MFSTPRVRLPIWILVLLFGALTLAATLGGSPATSTPRASAQVEETSVLFFHRTTGFRHDSIPNALQAVQELGAQNGFTVTETQDPTVFNDTALRGYDAIVLFTDGEGTLSHAQRTAFERYVQRGGGVVGLHSTSNMDKTDWPWWEDLLGGAFFDNHPPIQTATMNVEDPTHPATAHLPSAWQWEDEWYNFTADPRDRNVHVLLSVDETTYTGGTHGAGHPIAWCSNFDGGRTFYTAIGHSASAYGDGLFRGHILGGIQWAAGLSEGNCGEAREGPPTEASFEKVALDDNTANPMKMDIAPDGRVFYTELGGTLKVWHPDTQGITVAAQINVFRDHENGLLGIALDPDFESNQWIYLYHSDPGEREVDGTIGGVQQLSRFTLDPQTETLIPDSEKVLLEFPHQRQECCHSSGDLEFDSLGNLYLSTGDDTNPFGSQNFAPLDYRDGRAPWDAARSAGNTADLRGKVLRITPLDNPGDVPGLGSTYTVPDDNLFTPANTTYHHLFPGGVYDPQLARPEIYVMGLRNPFTLAIEPGTDYLWIADVGPDANPPGGFDPNRGPRGYDSWTQVRQAGNYGWPFCYIAQEPYRQWDFATQTPGEFYDCANGATNDSPRNTGLDQLPPATSRTIWYPYCNSAGGYTAPVPFPEIPCGPVPGGAAYGTGRLANMGDFYTFDPALVADGKFPAIYDGKLFALEWERDIVASLTLDENRDYVPGSFEEFAFRWRFDNSLRFRKPHDLKFGPDGNMYLIEWGDEFNFAGGGVNPDSGLYRISYVKGGRTPVARAAATPDSGQPPLDVSFSSAGSFDPDGDEITFEWDFGDGTTSTEANPTHTYTEAGTYQVQLVVSDGERSSSSSLTVTVGNTRPQVTIETPPHGFIFNWGDQIPYQVSVTDAEDGSTETGGINCAAVTVQRGLFHRTGGAGHVHPGPTQSGCEGTIVTQADADHGEAADIATVITASYTDLGGLTGGVTHLLQPELKQAEFFNDSSGITVGASGDDQGGDAIAGQAGAWARYEPINLEGVNQLSLRTSAAADTTVELRRDAPDGPVIATAQVPATVTEIGRVPGPTGFGNAVRLNGPSPIQSVNMPTGILSGLTGDFTIAGWVNREVLGQTWSRIFDFGTGTGNFMFLTANAGGANNGLRFDILEAGAGSSQLITPPAGQGQELPTGWQHVAVTLSGNTGTIWVNGEPYATNENITQRAANLGETTQNWIGRSQFAADPLLNATVDDFQIFDRALTQAELGTLMSTPGGDVGGGNVAWYRFDEDGGTTALDSSTRGNNASLGLAPGAQGWTNVTLDLPETSGTFPLYLVFPGEQARVNWIEFGEPGDPEPPGPECLDPEVPRSVSDEFDGDAIDGCRWNRVVRYNPDLLDVSGGQLHLVTTGQDIFGGDQGLPNIVTQTAPSGDWTIETKMHAPLARNFQNAGFIVRDDDDNYLKTGITATSQPGATRTLVAEMAHEVGGAPQFPLVGDPVPGDVDDWWLRLTKQGDTYSAAWSLDGQSWTPLSDTRTIALSDPGIGLYATGSTQQQAGQQVTVSWDYFRLAGEKVKKPKKPKPPKG